ncbi:MAG: hypothetical protein QN120_00610 [Armatimonadota bacterium]|nr:hypothetical protein [Armatimonadota bacterium]
MLGGKNRSLTAEEAGRALAQCASGLTETIAAALGQFGAVDAREALILAIVAAAWTLDHGESLKPLPADRRQAARVAFYERICASAVEKFHLDEAGLDEFLATLESRLSEYERPARRALIAGQRDGADLGHLILARLTGSPGGAEAASAGRAVFTDSVLAAARMLRDARVR